MWQLDHKEGWALKNGCLKIVMLEKTLESPLNSKEIIPVNPKGNQLWLFIGRADAEAEAPVLWPPDTKSWLIGKYPDMGKDWRQEEKGATEDEMVGWHHGLNRHESEQAPGDSEGQGSLNAIVHGVTKSLTWRSNWTTNLLYFKFSWENHSVLLKLILSMLHPNALGSLWSYHAPTPWTQLLCPFAPSTTIFAEL